MKELILAAIMLIALFEVRAAHADQEYVGNIGITYGISAPDAAGTSTRPIYGVQGTLKLAPNWALGAYYVNSSKSEMIGHSSTDFNYQLYGVKVSYIMEEFLKGLSFAALIGTSKFKYGSADAAPAHFGAAVGYDYRLTDMFSIGAGLSYIAFSSSDADTPAGTTNLNSFDAVNFALGSKFGSKKSGRNH